VCFSQCVACDQAPEEFTLTLIVDASLLDEINPDGGIHVAGTFNGFSPTAMTDDGGGLYSISYEVAEGSTVLYKFLNSTDFSAAENVPSECGQDDGFGGFNRVFAMPSEDATVGPVCFGACVTCDLVPAEFTLTLIVDASELDQINPDGGIHVAGTFNGFSPTPMNDDGNGLYSISYQVTEGATVEYKFLNSSDFSAAEEVPEACGVPDGFEGFNRSLTMPSNDLTEGPVCFGECEACDFVVPCENPYPQVDINSITAETRPSGNIVWNWDFIPGQLGCRINVLVGNGPQQGTFIKLGPEVNEFIAPASQLVPFTTYSFRVQCGCSQQPFIVGQYTDFVPFFYNPGSAIIDGDGADLADDIVYTDNLTNLWQNVTYQEGLVIGGWTHTAEETTLLASPNPSNGQTFVTLSAREQVTQGQIEVFDTAGRLVETLYSGTIPAQDELRLEFDGNDLPEGVYLIRFTTNEEVVTEKFILSR
jgi:hypothetical protein